MKIEFNRKKKEFSKVVCDTRLLLWIVTVGGLALAWYCVYKEFDAALPWLSAMVGLPWAAHGVICSFYLNMAKSDHREGGITFEQAMANLNQTTSVDADINNINGGEGL